jgi:hypothetical protein
MVFAKDVCRDEGTEREWAIREVRELYIMKATCICTCITTLQQYLTGPELVLSPDEALIERFLFGKFPDWASSARQVLSISSAFGHKTCCVVCQIAGN